MTYIYDLILNFNNELLEFYEWDKSDELLHIKKINLIKIKSSVYNEILDNEISFSNDFLIEIFNKCEYFDQQRVKKLPYAVLVTDSYRVMALQMNSEGKIIKYSSLLLDEEEDTLEISIRIPLSKIEYNVIRKKELNNFTRKENNIIKYIKKELSNCYQAKDFNKLKFLYYEYSNKMCEDLDCMYQYLLNELSSNIDERHYNLYNLIKLSYSNKSKI